MSAYVLIEIEVLDQELCETYKQLAPSSIAVYGGRYLARGEDAFPPQLAWPLPHVHQHDDHAWDLLERAVQLTSEEALTVWTAYRIDDKQELAFVRPRSQERRQEDESADPVR
jgi:hypothetical protein